MEGFSRLQMDLQQAVEAYTTGQKRLHDRL